MKRRRPAARGPRARQRREVAKVARLVGTNGLRSYPWHWVLQQQIKAGIAPSEGLIAAAERARREWDAR